MQLQDTASQLSEAIDLPVLLEDGKFQWRGQIYSPMPPKNEQISKAKFPKLKLPCLHDKSQLKDLFCIAIFFTVVICTVSFAYLFYETGTAWTPIFVTLFTPVLSLALLARLCGRWWYCKEIVPFRHFSGTKQEWMDMVKRVMLGNMDFRSDCPEEIEWRSMQLAMELAGRKVTVLGITQEELGRWGLCFSSMLMCFQASVELSKPEERSDKALLQVLKFGLMVMFATVYLVGVESGRQKELNERVVELRRGCQITNEEEKAEKGAVIGMEWIIEQLLLINEDSPERAQDRRAVVIDPILAMYSG